MSLENIRPLQKILDDLEEAIRNCKDEKSICAVGYHSRSAWCAYFFESLNYFKTAKTYRKRIENLHDSAIECVGRVIVNNTNDYAQIHYRNIKWRRELIRVLHREEGKYDIQGVNRILEEELAGSRE